MRRLVHLAPVLGLWGLLLVFSCGCAPPELLEAAQDAGAQETGMPDQASFGQVAELVRGSCSSNPSCHGESGFTNFSVEGNGAATDAQVRAALEGVTTVDGSEMVVPGDAGSSALYSRLEADGSRRMPPQGQPELSQQDIDLVEQWIEEGANYE